MRKSRPPLLPAAVEPGGVVDEATWMGVIGKMDEVYSQLIADEVALKEKNAALEQSQQFIDGPRSSMSDVPVACDLLGTGADQHRPVCAGGPARSRPASSVAGA